MKTNRAPTLLVSVILTLAAARNVTMAQEYSDPAETPLGELTDGYAPGSVVYEAPVIYNGPVLYEAPVVYNGPVYYVNQTPEFVAPQPAPAASSDATSTVVVIGGGGAYGYGHRGDSGQSVIRFGREGGWFGR
jgi:hypothetical protein